MHTNPPPPPTHTQRDKMLENHLLFEYIFHFIMFLTAKKECKFCNVEKLPINNICIFRIFNLKIKMYIKEKVLGLENLHECAKIKRVDNFDHRIIRPGRSGYRF